MNALVLGYGRSGKAAETLLCRVGFSVTVLDGETPFPDGAYDVAVVSPGIALTHPWIVEATRRGIPLKSELQLGCEELKQQGWKLLAITGSKGKSSVVKVVADAINLSGQHAVPCGNYGLPVSEVALSSSSSSPWAVVEVSSFMMETTELSADTFEAAAILNLQEDHLDRHGSVEVYHGLKRKLLTMARRKVECDGFHLKRSGDRFSAIKDRSPFSSGEDAPRIVPPSELASLGGYASPLWEGSYFDNEILEGNATVAAELMRAAGLSDETIRRAFLEFKPLPHRMNTIAKLNGVRYIDDSKATSLAALEAGVKMASASLQPPTFNLQPSLRLIAGGLPKGDDPKSALATLTERVRKVYLIGQSAEAFHAAWKGAVDCEICGTMEKAVECVKREAERGETVLLSPGTASFDQFKSYGERGEVFARLVKEKENDK